MTLHRLGFCSIVSFVFLLDNTTIASTAGISLFSTFELSKRVYILPECFLACRLGLPRTPFQVSPLTITSPWLFLVSISNMPLGPTTMWSIFPQRSPSFNKTASETSISFALRHRGSRHEHSFFGFFLKF